MFPTTVLLYLVCFCVHDWPSTCLFRMDHHVAPDIRHHKPPQSLRLAKLALTMRLCRPYVRSGPFRSSMSDTRQHPCPYFHNSSSKSGRLDQEVTSFEILRPSFKVRQIPDMETFMVACTACDLSGQSSAFRANRSTSHRGGAGWYTAIPYPTYRTVTMRQEPERSGMAWQPLA